MSSPPTHLDLPSDSAEASFDERARSLLQTVHRHVFTPVRAAGFWSAIALPFLYVPLVATGLETEAELTVFLALLAANVVAIALGHSHSPGSN